MTTSIAMLVADAAVRLREARSLPIGDVPAAEIGALCREVQAVVADAQALLLTATAAGDTVDVASREGATSMTAWMAQTTGVSAKKAHADVQLARELDTVAPRTRDAIGRPGISTDKARVIAHALTELPADVTPDERLVVEDDLLERAERYSLEDLKRSARRSLETIDRVRADEQEKKALERQEAKAAREATFWMSSPGDDGMVTGGFCISTLAAGFLRTSLDALTSPRKSCPDAEADDPSEESSQATPLDGEVLTHAQKQGRAFSTILEHLPTDRLGQHGSNTATLVVSIDADQLRDDLGAASLSTGERISAGEARRLACNAGIIPVVFGGSSLPLDLGLKKRIFTTAQKYALAERDGGCAFPGCDRPPSWTEVHHIDYWSHGGPTDLAHGVLLCAHHHRLIHHSPWEIRLGEVGDPTFIPPRSVDAAQRPRRNERWRPLRAA